MTEEGGILYLLPQTTTVLHGAAFVLKKRLKTLSSNLGCLPGTLGRVAPKKSWLLHRGLFGQEKLQKKRVFSVGNCFFPLEGSSFQARFFLSFSGLFLIIIKKTILFFLFMQTFHQFLQQGILIFAFDAKKGSQVVKNTYVTFSDLFFG